MCNRRKIKCKWILISNCLKSAAIKLGFVHFVKQSFALASLVVEFNNFEVGHLTVICHYCPVGKIVTGEQQAILRLPEKQRIVFNLRYYDELSYEEIGQILNSSVNTLKTNIEVRARSVMLNFMPARLAGGVSASQQKKCKHLVRSICII